MATLEQAQEAAKAKQWERSLELYNEAVEASPTAEALVGRAQVHNKLGNYMEAAADASTAIELNDKLAAAHKEKGHACYNLEEYESAMDAFEAAAALEPGKGIHKTWVNMCKVQLGEELPPPPTAPSLAAQPFEPQALASTSGRADAAGPSGSDAKQGSLNLQGEELQSFLRQMQAASRAGVLPTPEALRGTEEQGSEQPKHARVDDPEFSKYWKAPVSAAVAASIPDKPAGSKYRHQWFQSAERVEVDVLAKGLKKEQVDVTIEQRRLRVVTTSQAGEQEYDLDLVLHGEVVPQDSHYEVLGSKIEIKLKKAAAAQWPSLEQQQGSGASAAAPEPAPAAAVETPAAAAESSKPSARPTPVYPYAGKKVDWDKLAHEVQQEEKEEKLEGDQALMKFFRELYEGGDEDTRRAMVKSMQESGGTALSMSWKEVGKRDFSKRGKGGDEEELEEQWSREG